VLQLVFLHEGGEGIESTSLCREGREGGKKFFFLKRKKSDRRRSSWFPEEGDLIAALGKDHVIDKQKKEGSRARLLRKRDAKRAYRLGKRGKGSTMSSLSEEK